MASLIDDARWLRPGVSFVGSWDGVQVERYVIWSPKAAMVIVADDTLENA